MFERVVRLFQEVRLEMSKVTWPSREELVSSTGVVIVLSLAFALFIGVFDRLLSFVINTILGR
jgi:preprotein translocase subunit SecE